MSYAALAMGLALLFPQGAPRSSESESANHERVRVAVLELHPGRGVDQKLAQALSELLVERVAASGLGDECVGWNDVRNMLDFEQRKQLLGCEEASCLAEVGGALGVQRMVSGSVARVGDRFLLTLTLIDVERARVLARSSAEPADENGLLAAIPGAVVELVRQVGGAATPRGATRTTGVLVVRSEPSVSRVLVDGREVGVTPVRLEKITPGVYEVQVMHRDYSTHIGRYTVVPGQETIVEVELELDPEIARRNYQLMLERYRRKALWNSIWGWTMALGGGAALAATTLNLFAERPADATPSDWLWNRVVSWGLWAGAVGITATGILKIVKPPEPPQPPEVLRHENDAAEGAASQPSTPRAAAEAGP